MARQTLETKVETLERRVTTLEQLPERIDRLESQILQFQAEVRSEFSAVREELRAGDQEPRRTLREEIRPGDEETRRTLRDEIRTGNVMVVTALTEQMEEYKRHMRMLHEDFVDRFRLVGERLAARDDKIDAVQAENRAMFERLLARAEALTIRPKRKRR